ncbi:hypothetical protein BGX26_006005, partial [Mortierella sp. AD094]
AVDQDVIDDLAKGVTKAQGHFEDGKKGWKNMRLTKVFGDTFEALIGAVYVDAGFELGPVHEVLQRTLILFVDENEVVVAEV